MLSQHALAQTVAEKLQIAVAKFETDKQLENALYSLYVIDAKTGKPLLQKNENIGMATASCMKVITSATAYEVLGKAFTYNTLIGYTGTIANNTLNGNLIIQGSGDPSFGSFRYPETKPNAVLIKIVNALQQQNIKAITGSILLADGYNKNVTPSNWIWEDLGNYYGAPARLFNWHENQFDIHFSTDKNIGTQTTITNIDPPIPDVTFTNEVTTAEAGSGDNTIIYLPQYATTAIIKGTLPANDTNFVISGAMPNPSMAFGKMLLQKLKTGNIKITNPILSTTQLGTATKTKTPIKVITTIASPTLEALNYWFMKKSINLYGEAFLNKMAEQKQGVFATAKGVELVKAFWQQKGISPTALNMYDGSGLSPSNRVTTSTIIKVLDYASKQPWYSSYLNAFPLYNGMKLKSGTIGDVKGFSGYHTAADGSEYIISFLVNNYSGSTKALVSKMFAVLDVLK